MATETIGSLGFRSTERTARRERNCTDCGRRILIGQRYREVIAAPRYDFNPRPGHWTRGYFCIFRESPDGE